MTNMTRKLSIANFAKSEIENVNIYQIFINSLLIRSKFWFQTWIWTWKIRMWNLNHVFEICKEIKHFQNFKEIKISSQHEIMHFYKKLEITIQHEYFCWLSMLNWYS